MGMEKRRQHVVAPRHKTPKCRELKLARDRETKRVARAQYLAECAALNTELVELTAKLHLMDRRPSQLPWKEVAAAMNLAVSDVVHESQRLHTRMIRCDALQHSLVRWVHAVAALEQANRPTAADDRSDMPVKHSTLPADDRSDMPVKHSTLPADDLAWTVGLQWYARKMHITNARYMRPFPDSARDVMQVDVTKGNSFVYVQKTIPGDMARVASSLWRVVLRLSHPSCKTLVRETTTDQDVWYIRKSVLGVTRNCLHVKVAERHRISIGFRTMYQDLAHPLDSAPLEDYQEWATVEAVDADHCRVRVVSCTQPYATYETMSAYAKAVHPDVFADVAKSPPEEHELRATTLLRRMKQAHATYTAMRLDQLIHDDLYLMESLPSG